MGNHPCFLCRGGVIFPLQDTCHPYEMLYGCDRCHEWFSKCHLCKSLRHIHDLRWLRWARSSKTPVLVCRTCRKQDPFELREKLGHPGVRPLLHLCATSCAYLIRRRLPEESYPDVLDQLPDELADELLGRLESMKPRVGDF